MTSPPSAPGPVIALVAGEASGDQLGAALVARLRQTWPRATFVGIAGPRMREAGVDAWWDTQDAWQRLGFVPQDSSEPFAAKVQHITFDPQTPMAQLQGGRFLDIGVPEDYARAAEVLGAGQDKGQGNRK